MAPELLASQIVNWALGTVSLISVVGIILFPILTVIMAIVEGGKKIPEGVKRSFKKTAIFGILFGASIALLVLVLVAWGIANYALRASLVY